MCSGCFRKGEKSMRCQYCGNEMREGALFCSQCGNRAVSQAAPVKKICPNCGEEGAPDMLLGYRLVTSTHMPVIAAAAKPILFGDLTSYWIADREGRSMQRLNELYAATG